MGLLSYDDPKVSVLTWEATIIWPIDLFSNMKLELYASNRKNHETKVNPKGFELVMWKYDLYFCKQSHLLSKVYTHKSIGNTNMVARSNQSLFFNCTLHSAAAGHNDSHQRDDTKQTTHNLQRAATFLLLLVFTFSLYLQRL